MKIQLNCAECENTRFNLSDADTDWSVVVCEDCGHVVGTFAELKQKVADEVLKRASAA